MFRFRQARRTASRVIDGSAFVVAIDQQNLLELNEVGTLLWERLEEPATVEGLVAAVAEEFDVQDDVARQDVQAFLDKLLERGVIVREDGAP